MIDLTTAQHYFLPHGLLNSNTWTGNAGKTASASDQDVANRPISRGVTAALASWKKKVSNECCSFD